MKRIIVIDGCSANIIFPSSVKELPVPSRTIAGGRLMKAAMLLGSTGHNVEMMGEAGRDPLGDILVGFLRQSGVNTDCVDRYSDGASTPSILVFPSEIPEAQPRSVVYRVEMAERWDSRWPRIDAGDIVLFGGYFALQPRVRPLLLDFLENARQRKALIVNMPGFNPALAPAVTRVMPSLLENLECSDVVMTASPDLLHIFGTDDASKCFHDKIGFYSPMMLNLEPVSGTITLMRRGDVITRQGRPDVTPHYPILSGMTLAAFIDALIQTDINAETLPSLPLSVLENIALLTANCSLSSNIIL